MGACFAPARKKSKARKADQAFNPQEAHAYWYAPAARGGLISERRVRERRDASLHFEKTALNKTIPGY